MKIHITGRHVGVTEAMKEYAKEKAEKLARIHERLTRVEVTLDVVHDTHVVEFVADAPRGARLVGKAESPDMYAAVDLAEDKLLRQVVKLKERLSDHHRGEAREEFRADPLDGAADAVPPGTSPAMGVDGPGEE